MKQLFILFQYLIPQHLLSRLVGKIAQCRVGWIKNLFISQFARHFEVDMSEAQPADARQYPNFNSFFTRSLRAGVRPLCSNSHIACPADGSISQIGRLRGGRIVQAKGQSYSSIELLGGEPALAAQFDNGSFATIYLSPKDYHRVHMPCDGRLQQTVYIPGDLFSVNQTTAAGVPRLFARNERLVSVFATELGPMASVMVGAMIVAGIETVWAGQQVPVPRQIKTTRFDQPVEPVTLHRGQEMGRFMLGSTVILLFAPDTIDWLDGLGPGSEVRMGQAIASILSSAATPSP
jgi:phosphatidylserine decarboxylase